MKNHQGRSTPYNIPLWKMRIDSKNTYPSFSILHSRFCSMLSLFPTLINLVLSSVAFYVSHIIETQSSSRIVLLFVLLVWLIGYACLRCGTIGLCSLVGGGVSLWRLGLWENMHILKICSV